MLCYATPVTLPLYCYLWYSNSPLWSSYWYNNLLWYYTANNTEIYLLWYYYYSKTPNTILVLIQQLAMPLYCSQYSNPSVMILSIQQYSNYDTTNTETAICHVTNLTLLQQYSCNLSVMLLPLYSWIPLSHNISRPFSTIQLYPSIINLYYSLYYQPSKQCTLLPNIPSLSG